MREIQVVFGIDVETGIGSWTPFFLTNTLNFVLLSLTNLLGGTFFQVQNMIVPYTFLDGGSMNKLTLLNYRVWNIYLLLLVSLLLLGCSYAGKPTFKSCQDV